MRVSTRTIAIVLFLGVAFILGVYLFLVSSLEKTTSPSLKKTYSDNIKPVQELYRPLPKVITSTKNKNLEVQPQPEDTLVSFSDEKNDLLRHEEIADSFNIASTDVITTQIDPEIFSLLSPGDSFVLPIPGESSLEAIVSDVTQSVDEQVIQGVLDGFDKGFGVSIAKYGSNYAGYIITPEYYYDVVTLRNKTYLLRKSHNKEPAMPVRD